MATNPFMLDPEEMAMARAPAELAKWVNERCEKLGESPEAKSYGRFGDKWPKKFYEEIRPLSIYAAATYADVSGAMVKANLGNENYDGVIELTNGDRVLVEITSAKHGYSESQRMDGGTRKERPR